jgi:hypothetical protein
MALTLIQSSHKKQKVVATYESKLDLSISADNYLSCSTILEVIIANYLLCFMYWILSNVLLCCSQWCYHRTSDLPTPLRDSWELPGAWILCQCVSFCKPVTSKNYQSTRVTKNKHVWQYAIFYPHWHCNGRLEFNKNVVKASTKCRGHSVRLHKSSH